MKTALRINLKEIFHSIAPVVIFFIFTFNNHIIAGIILGYFYLAIVSFIYSQLKEASIFTYTILIFEILFFTILVPLSYF